MQRYRDVDTWSGFPCQWQRVADEAAEYRVWVEIKYGFGKARLAAADAERLRYSSRVHRLKKLVTELGVNTERDLDWYQRGGSKRAKARDYDWSEHFGLEQPPDYSVERLLDLIHGKEDVGEET